MRKAFVNLVNCMIYCFMYINVWLEGGIQILKTALDEIRTLSGKYHPRING